MSDLPDSIHERLVAGETVTPGDLAEAHFAELLDTALPEIDAEVAEAEAEWRRVTRETEVLADLPPKVAAAKADLLSALRGLRRAVEKWHDAVERYGLFDHRIRAELLVGPGVADPRVPTLSGHLNAQHVLEHVTGVREHYEGVNGESADVLLERFLKG